MAILYSWSPKSGVTLSPQAVGEKMEELANQHPVVTPEIVLGEALRPDSPLHAYFEMDDAKAAHQHRLTQARELMRFIYVQDTERDTQPHRLFVSLRRADSIPQEDLRKTYSLAIAGTGDGYVRLTSTPTQNQLRGRVVEQALRELYLWREKYREYEVELAGLFAAIDELHSQPHPVPVA